MASQYDGTGRRKLDLSGLLAASIPYDPSDTSLPAPNVQDAIDALFDLIGGGARYVGHVDATASAEVVPSGWSASASSNEFTVTHNLGHTNYFVQLTAFHDGAASSDDAFTAHLISKNNDTFVYRTFRSEDTVTTGAATAVDFELQVIS